MTGKNALATLLSLVMLAAVIGSYSLVGAQNEEKAEPPRPRVEADRPPERPRDEARREAPRREQEERMRREQEERMRREQEERERRAREGQPGREGRESPHRGEPQPFRPEHADQFRRMMEMIERTRQSCFNPEVAAMIAAAGLRDEVPRKPNEVIDDLEATLKKTKTLGLRNSLRMLLRDLYRDRGKHDRVLEHLHQMLEENDQALQAEQHKPRKDGKE